MSVDRNIDDPEHWELLPPKLVDLGPADPDVAYQQLVTRSVIDDLQAATDTADRLREVLTAVHVRWPAAVEAVADAIGIRLAAVGIPTRGGSRDDAGSSAAATIPTSLKARP